MLAGFAVIRHQEVGTIMLKTLTVAGLLSVLPLAAAAQDQGGKTVTKQNQMTAVATIRAIDQATRSVTLRSENGDEDTFTVGPEVTRFNELKVGDKIRATYFEALVFQLRKPGAPSTPSSDTLAGGRIKEVPGGALGTQQTRTVTVKAVDMNAPSITVVTQDGRTLTRKIGDKKNLEGVKAGDRIDITYTQAVVVNAEAAK
jgi:Cu/Ag efflux protein CusF